MTLDGFLLSRRRVAIAVFLVHVPLVSMIGLVGGYVSIYALQASRYTYDLPGPIILRVSNEQLLLGERNPADVVRGALTRLLTARSDISTIVVGGGAADQAGLGVFDPAGQLTALPFTPSDYASTARLVSVSRQSALATVDPTAVLALTRADRLVATYSGIEFVDASYAYTLLAAASFDGTWVLSGVGAASAADAIGSLLRDAGYDTAIVLDNPAPLHSLYLWAALASVAMSCVASCSAWLTQVGRLKPGLRVRRLLGASRRRAVVGQLPAVLTAWAASLAVGLAAAAAVLIAVSIPLLGSRFPLEASGIFVIATLLTIDLGLTSVAFVARTLPMTRI